MSEDMISKATKIIKKREIRYMQTNGNMHIFQAKAHAKDTAPYMITAKLQPFGNGLNNSIEWDCECKAYEYSKDKPQVCKHIVASKEVFKKEKLREDYHLSQDANFQEAQDKIKACDNPLSDIDKKIEFAGSDLY